MPAIRLPIFDQSLFQEPIEKQVKTLADFIMRYRRELEWLLNGKLDKDNGVVAADMVITNTLVTNTLYAEYGRIARLSVSELNTAWKKITNYLASDTSDVNYIRMYEQYALWITATTDGLATQHEVDYDNNLLYWTDGTHTGMTTTVNAFPVTTYVYTELTKWDMSFQLVGSYYVPMALIGAGTGVGNNGKGYIYKDALNDLHIGVYHASTGAQVGIVAEDNGVLKRGGTGDTQLRNISHLAVGDTLPTALEDGDIVYQGFSASDKLEVNAAATLYVQVDGLPQPTFIRVSSGAAVTLPTDAGLSDGVELTIKNVSSSVTSSIVGTIDGNNPFTLQPYGCIHIRYNGTNWDILSHYFGLS